MKRDHHSDQGRKKTGNASTNPPINPGQRDYEDMPAVTNRQWGESSEGNDAYSYGYDGQGGYGDFTQGGYGEDQGRPTLPRATPRASVIAAVARATT